MHLLIHPMKYNVLFDRIEESMKWFTLFKVAVINRLTKVLVWPAVVGEFRLWMCWFVASIIFIVLAVLFD